MNNKHQIRKNTAAFTIVELLIVIIVIAILAAIAIIAYNGVQKRALQSLLRSELAAAARTLESDKVVIGEYPSDLTAASNGRGLQSQKVVYQYTKQGVGTPSTFCLTGTVDTISLSITSSQKEPSSSICAGHSDPNRVVAVAQKNVSSYTIPSATETSVVVPGQLEAGDTVLIVMAADYNSELVNARFSSAPADKVYERSLGVSGYQKIVVYRGVGLTGSQTFTIGSGWNIEPTHPSAPAQNGQILTYVIKGLSNPSAVQIQDTAYGTKSASTLSAPAPINATVKQFAVFAYVNYSNEYPAFTDQSSPAVSWTVDNTQTPSASSRTKISARSLIVPSSTQLLPGLTTAATGSNNNGAVLLVFGN